MEHWTLMVLDQYSEAHNDTQADPRQHPEWCKGHMHKCAAGG